jgi:hypothetical protein
MNANVDGAEVEAFLNNHIRPFRQWFEQQSNYYIRRVTLIRNITIGSGFIATIIAAFPVSSVITAGYAPEIAKWFVVVFSSLSTICSGALYSTYFQAAQRREAGRVQIFRIEHLAARHLYFAQMTPEERVKYESETIEQVMHIDGEYGSPIGLSGDDPNRPKPKPHPMNSN